MKQATSGDSLQSPGHQNIPQVPGNRAQLGQNHDARKAVLATILVLKLSTVVFRPRSSKVKVQKVLLSLEFLGRNTTVFHFKTKIVAKTAIRA